MKFIAQSIKYELELLCKIYNDIPNYIIIVLTLLRSLNHRLCIALN